MIEQLYCDPKEEVIMDCFLKNVNTNDLNGNLPQPNKKKITQMSYLLTAGQSI